MSTEGLYTYTEDHIGGIVLSSPDGETRYLQGEEDCESFLKEMEAIENCWWDGKPVNANIAYGWKSQEEQESNYISHYFEG